MAVRASRPLVTIPSAAGAAQIGAGDRLTVEVRRERDAADPGRLGERITVTVLLNDSDELIAVTI